MTLKAWVEHDYIMGRVRVWLIDVAGDTRRVLGPDGFFVDVPAGLSNPPDAKPTIEVYDAYWPEVAQAIVADFLATNPDPATAAKAEAKVLREWLEKEQARVDAFWSRLL